MGDFDNLAKCSLGPASFTLDKYKVKEDPVVEQDIGRTGTTITITGSGWIAATSAADFAAAIAALPAASRISGQAFTIYGCGGAVEYQLLPQSCVDGGPHVGLEIGEQTEAMIKPITFNVTATTAPPTTGAITGSGYTETITTGPDGLRSVSRDGKLVGVSVSDALGTFKGIYPPDRWIIQYKSASDQNGLNVTYTFAADELAQSYGNDSSATSSIVDGEGTVRTERDEQYRLNTTYEYDLIVIGDYLDIADQLRADAVDQEAARNKQENSKDDGDEATILRESVEASLFKQIHLRASFSFLRGADANRLLNWSQSIALAKSGDAYTIQQYSGADPVLIKQPGTKRRVVQSGEAIGLGAYPVEPDALYDDAFLEEPQVTLSRVSELECKTQWSYTMAAPDDFDPNDHVDALDRPSSPEFYGS